MGIELTLAEVQILIDWWEHQLLDLRIDCEAEVHRNGLFRLAQLRVARARLLVRGQIGGGAALQRSRG